MTSSRFTPYPSLSTPRILFLGKNGKNGKNGQVGWEIQRALAPLATGGRAPAA
ncbi:hypothetical protein [Halomonas sp.]|uniref:hypothetical protein n=1 Tax=Halomonas sp. TaxID=1486246 RepID=UPI003568E438